MHPVYITGCTPCTLRARCVITSQKEKKEKKNSNLDHSKVPPGFEPGSLGSEPRVLTVTPRNPTSEQLCSAGVCPFHRGTSWTSGQLQCLATL